jgi:hypothetical protein
MDRPPPLFFLSLMRTFRSLSPIILTSPLTPPWIPIKDKTFLIRQDKIRQDKTRRYKRHEERRQEETRQEEKQDKHDYRPKVTSKIDKILTHIGRGKSKAKRPEQKLILDLLGLSYL